MSTAAVERKTKREPKYFGDVDPELVWSPEAVKASTKLVLPASEIARVQQQIQELSGSQSVQKQSLEERIRLHESSKERVKNWDNTVYGQRRRKLRARDERLAAEEAERVKLDEEHERLEKEFRDNYIAHARLQQYKNEDFVKRFQSQLLLNQVLKERDMQLEYKNRMKAESKKQEELLRQQALKDQESNKLRAQPGVSQDEELARASKARQEREAIAEEQRLQQEARLRAIKEQRQKQLEEGTSVMQKDAEYNAKQKEREVALHESRLKLRGELQQMKEEAVKRRKEVEVAVAKQDQINAAWIKRKDQLLVRKKIIESERFKEHLRVREEMGTRQRELWQKKMDNVNERIAVAEAEIDRKQQEREKAKRDKTAHEFAEIAKHRQMAMLHVQQKKNKEIEDGKATLAEHERVRQDVEQKRQERKNRLLREGQQLQSIHQAQIDRNIRNRQQERQESIESVAMREEQLNKDRASFDKFATSLLDESWVKNQKDEDPRSVHKFVAKVRASQLFDESLHAYGTPNPTTFHPNASRRPWEPTANRLGFVRNETVQENGDDDDYEPLLAYLSTSQL